MQFIDNTVFGPVMFPSMPSGVEHMLPMLVLSRLLHVMFPSMPSGVEHWVIASPRAGCRGCDVPIDEHPDDHGTFWEYVYVMFPSMPSGVEHQSLSSGSGIARCDVPIDAVRR